MPNLALLGSGLFATNSYLPALSQPSNKHITLHTLWSRSQSSVTTLSEEATSLGHSPRTLHGPDGLQTIWDDASIDAVALVLPITAQPDLIIAALKAGKHVISEKPVGKDVDAARELIKVYEKEYKPKGLIWRVAESESTVSRVPRNIESRWRGRGGDGEKQLRHLELTPDYEHDTLIRAAGEALRDDKLGPVLYWQLRTEGVVVDGSSYQATSWRTIPDYQGGE